MKRPESELKAQVKTFIRENLLGDTKQDVGDDESLLASGIIDSTGIVELIAHLESTFGVAFDDEELTSENFDSIQKITTFLSAKLSRR